VSPRTRLGLLLALLAAALAYAGIDQCRGALAPYRGYDGDSAVVVVPQGAWPSRVASILADAGVLRGRLPFTLLARVRGVSGKLQAGEYLFDRPMTPWEVLDKVVRGEVVLHRVTIPEGLTGLETLDRIVRARLVRRADLDAAFRDPAPIRDLDPEARDLEGYLFPETYRFPRGTSARRILEEMVARFREVYAEAAAARARELGMTPRQVATLASLIEEETSVPGERARVSAVFHNRLRLGMPLQCDPTVLYALTAAGRPPAELTRSHLEFASPYNTYVVTGLPPGPIASAGRASIEAAVRPDPVKDLYFVADGTGGHTFSVSLEDHERAVARYRRLKRMGA
jgi:UPF0755 protein